MNIRYLQSGVLALATCAAVTLTGTVASGAVDTTPPVFTKVPTASIPVGAVLDAWTCTDPNDEFALSPVYLDFNASDPESGISRYEQGDGQSEPVSIGLQDRITTDSRTADPADCIGGGRYSVYVRAVNGAELTSLSIFKYSPNAEGRLLVVQDTPSTDVAYLGVWAVSHFTGWSGGTTRKTSRSGAAVRLYVNFAQPSTDLYPATSALGLVMAKGPDRGKASVFLDGLKVATVNTYSATKVHRTVVWRASVSPGAHTLRVVNLATTGHPRIDIDAFVVLQKGSTDLAG